MVKDRMEGQIQRQITGKDRWTNGQMDGKKKELKEGRTDEWIDE